MKSSMKSPYKIKRAGSALAVLVGLFGLCSSSSALPLTWLDGPQAGQAFTSGGIVVKAINYDTGSLYNTLPTGTTMGYSGSPGAGVAGGETTLNALPQRAALNGQPGEDSWGIIKITDILATASDGQLHSVYNSIASSFELTAMFWGVHDFFLDQVSAGSGLPGGGQVIDGTGLRVDIYSGVKNFTQTGGPGARSSVSSYPTATDGTLELSLLSTPGFINANGTFGGSATEFESNTANVGYAALNVIGGASSGQFNTNAIGFGGSSGAQFTPGVAGQTSTDVWFSFTATQGVNGWDITSNDPMLANVTTPSNVADSGSSLAMLGMGIAFLAEAYRRRSRKA
jgi:hypothetical protein